MAAQRVGDMTLDELKVIIDQMITERVVQTRAWPRVQSDRPVREVLESIQQNLINPAPGEQTGVEMLLEEREQWNSG